MLSPRPLIFYLFVNRLKSNSLHNTSVKQNK